MLRMDDLDSRIYDHIKSTRRFAIVIGIVYLTVSIGVLGFVGWVIVMLMRHFGVL